VWQNARGWQPCFANASSCTRFLAKAFREQPLMKAFTLTLGAPQFGLNSTMRAPDAHANLCSMPR
jgi:hypothetical protein